jgi:hypothetical protein
MRLAYSADGGCTDKKWRPTGAAKEEGILMLAEARLASEG